MKKFPDLLLQDLQLLNILKIFIYHEEFEGKEDGYRKKPFL